MIPFVLAALGAPGRQLGFRRAVVGHVVLVTVLAFAGTRGDITPTAYGLLILGLVEGAALVGWRLTQMPKSQALEFLLTSPVQPRRLFAAEAAGGVGRFHAGMAERRPRFWPA